MILLYEETEEEKEKTKKIIEHIKKLYEYAIIKHDRDVEETGEIKKAHYHIVVRMKEARTRQAIAKELEMNYRHIEPSEKLRKALRYLTHQDYEDKAKYSVEEIETNLESELAKATVEEIKKEPEENRVLKIMGYIINEKPKTMTELLLWSVENNCYDALRRNSIMFREIMKERK